MRALRTHVSRALIPALLVVAFLPALPANIAPSHDALQVFTATWTYVSGLVTESHVPNWLPIGQYGVPSGVLLMYVTPVAWLTGLVGALLHAALGFSDLLLLFKITVWLEFVLFASGLLRLCELVIDSRTVRYVVVALAVFSSPWIMSLDGNFHAFYMTPWILWALGRAFQTGASRHLGAAALLSVFACVGNVPYFSPFLLLQLSVVAVPLIWMYPQNTVRLVRSPATWCWAAVAGAAFAIHFVVLTQGLAGLAILSPGRDPVTNHVPKAVFLTHAGVAMPARLAMEFLTGQATNGDNTFYVGLGTLVLLPASLLVRGRPVLRAIQILGVFLLLFSTGGLVASLSYHFPGMVFYRHISIVFGLFRILAFVCLGCVLDQLIRDPAVFADWRLRMPRRAGALAAGAVLVLVVAELSRAQVMGPDLQLVLFTDPSYLLIAVRLACYATLLLVAARVLRRRALPYVLMAAVLVDLLTFWGWGWLRWPRLDGPQTAMMKTIAAPRPTAPLGGRVTRDRLEAGGPALAFILNTQPLDLQQQYAHEYMLAGVDPCVPDLRADFIAGGVARLFSAHGLSFRPDADFERRVLADPALARDLACTGPRISSLARVVTVDRGSDWIQVTLENTGESSVPVTIAEAFMPGWTVARDGQPAPLTPHAGAFLGADVPRGVHRFDFRYRTPLASAWRAVEGLLAGVSALALLALALRRITQPAGRPGL